jgi:transaldolase
MRPANLKTRIFLDSGDPKETKEAIRLLGFLDGQTTNPSLIAKNPETKARLERGERFSKQELLDFYRRVVGEISRLTPEGSVSIEVYADENTFAEEMFEQGEEFARWIPNAHVKYPTTDRGLRAAHHSLKNGMRVNMTLCFSEEQAAAVHAITAGAKAGDVFLSPFVGRLDDIGLNGMDLIKNILRMYDGRSPVQVLTASVRNLDHFLYALALESSIITAPLKVLRDWATRNMVMPEKDFHYGPNLQPIPYRELDLQKRWTSFDIRHELTEKGLARFASDWNALLER